jgi:hypothetical protein
MTTFVGFQEDPPAPLFLAWEQPDGKTSPPTPPPPPAPPKPSADYVDLYFKFNIHGIPQPLFLISSDETYWNLPAGARPIAISFRPRTDLTDFSSYTPVSYELQYGSVPDGWHPLMDKITRTQISSGGFYPAVNAVPFPDKPYRVTMMMRQKFFLRPKTFNPRIYLRLYYTTDSSVFPTLKPMGTVRVNGTLTITPPGMIALSPNTDRSTRKITIDDILTVLDGAPDGVSIKRGSIVVPGRRSVDGTLHYVGYGTTAVKLTLEKDGYDDTEITVSIFIVINYFSGKFSSTPLKKGDKIWLLRPADTSRSVLGTNPYHEDSDAATAALHAGRFVSGRSKQLVTIRDRKRALGFHGSTANGVTSLPGAAGWGVNI